MARGQDQNEGVWINLTGKESFALSIRDGRIVAANKVTGGKLTKKPDIKIEAKPLHQYPGDTLDEKVRAELRDVIAQQEKIVKDNPGKFIHVYVSPQAFRKIVGIINEHQHEGALAQANALNDFVKSERERPRDNDRSERNENNGSERSQPNERRDRSESDSREPRQANDNNEHVRANGDNERRGGGNDYHNERETLGELSSRNNSEHDLGRSDRQPLPDRPPAGAVIRGR